MTIWSIFLVVKFVLFLAKKIRNSSAPITFSVFRPKGEIFELGTVYIPSKISPWPRPGFSLRRIPRLMSRQGGHIRSKWQLGAELLQKFFIFDGLVKSRKIPFFVIPAKAGIQCFQKLMTDLGPGFRRGDDFLRMHHIWWIVIIDLQIRIFNETQNHGLFFVLSQFRAFVIRLFLFWFPLVQLSDRKILYPDVNEVKTWIRPQRLS